MDLKAETIGLAVVLELPLVVIDVQRAGPSTGMPTKTEQSDLLMAIHGRHGESPLPVVAASTPGQCFEAAYEAARIAVRYRTPVILLSDLFLANSSEPWRIPDADALAPIDPASPRPTDEPFEPYARDEHGARPWAIPGTPGLAHRIGGLEKADVTGDISYDGANHARMTRDPGGQGRAASPPTCRRSRSTRTPAPSCSCSAGARAAARSAPPPAACAPTATPSPSPTCTTCTRCRPTSARCCTATSACWCRR